MKILDAAAVTARLPYARLVPALRDALARPAPAPQRVPFDLGGDARLLVMPAWNMRHLGVKLVNVFPDNARLGLPAVSSTYVLSDGRTGHVEAIIDGETLTARRTAAVAALGASFLAPAGGGNLLVIGAGRVARELPAALAAVRSIDAVTIWARRPEQAAALASELAAAGIAASPCEDLAKAVSAATIVACATLATEPIVRGDWLRPGTHLSLIGGFRPSMREADGAAIRRSHVVADTRSGVLAEAGDILIPIAEGLIDADHVKAELSDLCRMSIPPVLPRDTVTIFKSVGHAAQDLATALLCAEGWQECGATARGADDYARFRDMTANVPQAGD